MNGLHIPNLPCEHIDITEIWSLDEFPIVSDQWDFKPIQEDPTITEFPAHQTVSESASFESLQIGFVVLPSFTH